MSIFFMLSSYLIVTILLREHDETDRSVGEGLLRVGC